MCFLKIESVKDLLDLLVFVFVLSSFFWDFHVFDDNSLNPLGLKLTKLT